MPRNAFRKKIKNIAIIVDGEIETIELDSQENFKPSKSKAILQVKRIAQKIKHNQPQSEKDVQISDSLLGYETIDLANMQFNKLDFEHYQEKTKLREDNLPFLLDISFDDELNFNDENILNDFTIAMNLVILNFVNENTKIKLKKLVNINKL